MNSLFEKPEATNSTSLDAVRVAQAELRQKLQDAISELSPRFDALTEHKRKLSDELVQLILRPLPASEYGTLVQEWVGQIAKKGEDKVHAHLMGKVAHVKSRYGDSRAPLPFVIAERLMTGIDHREGTNVGEPSSEQPTRPIPVDDEGRVDFDVLCFLMRDQITRSLCDLLEKRPISYGHGASLTLGEGIERRRGEIASKKGDLKEIDDELSVVKAELTQLQRSLQGAA